MLKQRCFVQPATPCVPFSFALTIRFATNLPECISENCRQKKDEQQKFTDKASLSTKKPPRMMLMLQPFERNGHVATTMKFLSPRCRCEMNGQDEGIEVPQGPLWSRKVSYEPSEKESKIYPGICSCTAHALIFLKVDWFDKNHDLFFLYPILFSSTKNIASAWGVSQSEPPLSLQRLGTLLIRLLRI